MKVVSKFEPPEATPSAKLASRTAPTRAPDPLTDALLFLAGHHGRPLSRDALLNGLPLDYGVLRPTLVARAAQRAGLETEPVKRALAEFPALVLPAILIMREGARVLLRIDPAKKRATLVDPEKAKNSQEGLELSLAEIERDYSGYAFLVRPATGVDARIAAQGEAPREDWFWGTVSRFGGDYGQVALAAFFVNVLGFAAPLFFMSVYDRVIPNGAIASLVALSIGMVLAILFDLVLRMVRSRIIEVTGKKIDVVLGATIFEHAMAVKMAKRPRSVGVFASQLRDFDSVRDFFTAGSVLSVTDLLFALLFVAVLFWLAGPLAWIPLVMLPLMIVIGLLLQKPLDRAVKLLQAESSARHSILIEALSGIETIRVLSAEARMQQQWERALASTARTSENVNFWGAVALACSSTAQQLTSTLIIVFGAFLVLDGSLTVGALVAASMLSSRVLSPIAGIAAVITRATQTLSALKSIDGIMHLERERTPGRIYVSRPIERGQIAFQRVSFRYPDAASNALENVSFQIQAGERVGVIGRVGAGKSTIGKLLAGLYEPTEGRILIDGVDIRQYDPADLRRGIGFLLQDIDLFFGNVRDNISLGLQSATDEEVLAAARIAGVEDFIAATPLGYDLAIAEGGRSLSGGQKQAIALARVLIRDPKVLFLDEPTAHLDVRSEAELVGRLKALPGEKTLVVSTHRLSLLGLADRLLAFDHGRLIADGPKDKVLAALQAPPKPK